MSEGNHGKLHWILAAVSSAVFVALTYALYAWRDEALWIVILIHVVQTGALVLTFHRLVKTRGASAHVLRGVLILGGLFFSSLPLLYYRFGSAFFSWWYWDMPEWGGTLIALGVLSWLPSRWMALRASARSGWQSEWFAWTSSILALAAFYGVTKGVYAWVASVSAQAANSIEPYITPVAAVTAAAGVCYCGATLLYVRWMPSLLARRHLLWTVLWVLGAIVVALPLFVETESLPMGLRRAANAVLLHWRTAPIAGRAVLLGALVALWPRRSVPVA